MKYTAGKFTLTIDERDARLSELSLDGENLQGVSLGTPLFSLAALDRDNARITLTPADGRVQNGAIVFNHMNSGRGFLPIEAALTILETDGALSFHIGIRNRADGYCVVETLFETGGLTFGEDGDTALLYPHHAGEKILNPASALRSERYQSFWRAGTKEINGEWVRECNYCGLCSMSWMYLQNKNAGLYVASHDPRFPVTGLMAKTGGTGKKYLSLGFRVHKRIEKDETWESGAFTLCVSHDTWHSGAKRYRQWIQPYLAEHKNPEFLKNQAALNQCYNFKRTDEILNRFSDIPALWEEGNRRGINHMFIASWNRTGFDSFYPEYYPDMELGTALDFRRGIDYLNARGGFATLYVNARLSDMSSDFHHKFLSRMQIENEKGEALTETYGPHTFTLNCPSDEQWRHMLVDICDFAAESYRAKGIYLDQLASAEPFACYRADHTHGDIGEFNRGYVKILSDLRDRLRARDQDAYLMTENCGDIYSAYTWGNLTWNGTDYDEYYNLFRYTFPEFVQVNMCNDRSWEKDPEKRERFFYSDIERCVLMGNILWIGIAARYLGKPELRAHFDYLIAAVAFRSAIAAPVAGGVYLDDEYVAKIDPALHASSFLVSDTEALLLAGDSLRKGGSVEFSVPFCIRKAQAFDESGQPVQVDFHENRLTLTMNGERLVRITVCSQGRPI